MYNFSSHCLRVLLWIICFVQIAQSITSKANVAETLEETRHTEAEQKPSVPDIVTNAQTKHEDDKIFLIAPISDVQEPIETDTTKYQESMSMDVTKFTQTSKKRIGRRKTKKKSRRRDNLFHRRLLSDEMMNSPIKWLHCQDLLTPYITGLKSDIGPPLFLKATDRIVINFIRLLNLNTTGFTRDEMYSILFHVSQVQIRLFQWEQAAIDLLLSTLTKGYVHTFRNIQFGVKNLLSQWHLTLNDTALLLSETKMIRPLCMKVSEYGGSTKSSGGVRYTKPSTRKSTCLFRNGKFVSC